MIKKYIQKILAALKNGDEIFCIKSKNYIYKGLLTKKNDNVNLVNLVNVKSEDEEGELLIAE